MVGCAPLQSQLVNYAMVRWAEASSEKLEARPLRSWTKPQGWEALEQLLDKTVKANGMELDTNTATNGDCGVGFHQIRYSLPPEWLNGSDAE